MKKIAAILLVLATVTAFIFANGATEDDRIFFENMVRNSSQQSVAANTMNSSRTTTGSEIISRDMATLERLYQYVEKNFLFDIDYEAVYEAMATALFEALDDKYSYYVTAEESGDYAEEVSGQYGGLGIYFSKTYLSYQDPDDEQTLYAVISQVFPGTPCARAGLRSGDMIIEIAGESVVPLEATECAKLMKGEAGTSVQIKVKRGDNIFTLDLVREIITVPTVEYDMIDGKTAYLRILEISKNTYPSITEALTKLSDQGMQKLIIDLRDNSGGDVDVTLQILDLFISGSQLIKINYKDTSRNLTYVANNGTLVSPDVEVAILVNGGTASSAELFSASMRENNRAVIFGTTTYGKGIMQIVSSFGTGYTSITTASFTGPTGEPIHKEGVKPDFEVEAVTVSDDEVDAYTELMNSGDIKTFVNENPDYNDANLRKFASQKADSGLREEVLILLVRNEYLSRMNYDDRPIGDITYDVVCKAAYDYLQTYEASYATSTSDSNRVVVNF